MAAAKKPVAVDTAVSSALEPITQLQEKVRLSTEKGIEQFRAQYDAIKDAAEQATGKIEESVNAAQAGAKSFNLKALDFVRTNTNATLDHVQALFAVKSPADLFTLQGEFAKKQVEIYAAQAKELAELGQKVVAKAVEPVKSAAVLPFAK